MPTGENKGGMQCVEFEALLSDALDGTLTGQKLEAFQAHTRVCAVCSPMFAEAEAGRRWLKSLAEVEPPAQLMHNILVATIGRETSRVEELARHPRTSWSDALRGWLGPVIAVVRQPRFAMSFGMAFFSLSVSLSLAGVKLTDLRHADLRPSAIKRNYYEASGRVVKYYENIRLVYEIESRVQEFKKVTRPSERKNVKEQERDRKNNTSGQPEPRQERNYSRDENQPVLASAPDEPPALSVTTIRRLV